MDKLNVASIRTQMSALAAIGALLTLGSLSLGTADSDAVSAVSAGADTLGDTLKSVLLYALPIAAAIFAIRFGWRFAKSMVGGR